MISKKKNILFYFISLFFFSILFNQYYGYIGINPIDSFVSFNSGYDVLNGYYPFKDYWTITGPFIIFIQTIFFKLFGVNWFSYVLHASIFNFVFSICTFFTLYKFKLNIHYCFLYSFLVSFLAYPSAGTPYVDHQAAFTSIISIFCFILALKTDLKIYWFFLPIILFISFLTNQAPTGHIFLIICVLSLIHFIFNFDIRKIIYGICGSLSIILIFLIILLIAQIPFTSFFEQYILFPLSLGESRLQFIFPLEFQRTVLRFKLIHLSSFLLIIISIKKIIENYRYLIDSDFLIKFSLITSSYALIMHQLMTINGLFIFFLIPILAGFSHIYYMKYFKSKNYILYLLLLLSISSTIYYGYKYIHQRDFMDLRNVNKENAIDAGVIDKKLAGLKWITPFYKDDPEKEILLLKEAISKIDNNSDKKVIITDYQFISVILSSYDYSPSQVWYSYHVNPIKGSKYFEGYKKLFIEKLKKNNIDIIYVVKPLWGAHNIIKDTLNKNCFIENNETEILDSFLLIPCDDIKN